MKIRVKWKIQTIIQQSKEKAVRYSIDCNTSTRNFDQDFGSFRGFKIITVYTFKILVHFEALKLLPSILLVWFHLPVFRSFPLHLKNLAELCFKMSHMCEFQQNSLAE